MQARDREFVVEIARAIVGSVDPDSVRYVEADAEAYFAAPRRLSARRGADTPLGSGLEVAVTGLTMAAVYISKAALDLYLDEAIKKGTGGVLGFLKRRWGRDDERLALRDVPTFSEAQVEDVGRAVAAVAKGRGLDPTAADALAAAVRERLPREPGAATESAATDS